MHLLKRHPSVVPEWRTCLVLVWTAGICMGILVGAGKCHLLSANLISMCRAERDCIAALFCCIPLITAGTAVYFSFPGLVFPAAFFKAFADGILVIAIGGAFTSSAWLLCWLLFFSDRCTTVLFLWFCAGQLPGKCKPLLHDFFLSVFLSLLAVILDYFLVSPYLLKLMNQI